MRLKSLSLKVALLGGLALTIVFAVGMTFLVQQVSRTIEAQTRQLQTETTDRIAAAVSSGLMHAERSAEGIVTALEALQASGITDRAAYDAALRRFLERNTELLGAWSGWEANALDGNDAPFANTEGHDATGRFMPYWNRGSGAVIREVLMDYDDMGTAGAYYQAPKALDRTVAIEPYTYPVAGKDTLIMSIGAPIKKDGKYLGTGGIDLSLEGINVRVAQVKPFGTGNVSIISATGLVVAHPDATRIGQPLDKVDPLYAPFESALKADAAQEVTTTGAGGEAVRLMAVPFDAGTADRWVAISSVPVATLEASVIEGRTTIIALAAICVLVAGIILFGLIRQLVGGPLGRMSKTVTVMADGNYDVTVTDTGRTDEVGTLARAMEVFRQNGQKVAQMTEAEAVRIISDQEARAAMMKGLQQAFGNVVDAAVAGDFTQRVDAEFPDPELSAIAASINNLVETVDRGLAETAAVLGALADTDLTQRMEGNYQGAFAQLKQDTNAVADKLTAIVGQLKQTSRDLRTATGEILTGANDLSERTTKQAATIEETSAAMEQLASTVLANSQRASEASRNATDVTSAAEEGGQVMTKANGAMERITQSSAKISNIIGLIDDIAFQTNLLALNASVEAARAGDAGKGFAVVAIEVRRLAQSAASASSEVKVLIEQSGTEVSAGSKLVAEAAQKLETMLDAVRSNRALLEGIARDSSEQAAAISEVNVAVRQMDEMTQHNAALVEETNAAIEQTEAQATELDQVVAVFRTAGGDTVASRQLARKPARPAPAANPAARPAAARSSAAKAYLSQGNAAVDADWSEF
jgi:methyl-accepting chemotaxis protein